MAAITITLTHSCAGGGHNTFTVTGAFADVFVIDSADIAALMDDAERRAFIKGLVKLARVGRTTAQTMALFQAGVTVTI